MTSQIDQGAIWDVYLPLSRDPAPAYPRGKERILLVDDEEPVVDIQKILLERLGYTVEAFTDGLAALTIFGTRPRDFDLVITDMTMPDITGDKLAGKLVAARPDIPVVICTGFSERMNESVARSLGIKGYLTKPVALGQLAATVRGVLDARAG